MLRVVPDGENRFRLTDQLDRERGWIRGRAVRFTGFASEAEVLQSVRRVWHALESFLQREFSYRQRKTRFLENLRFVHDGAYEWITDGTIPVARIFRPPADRPDTGSYAMELVIPALAGTGAQIDAARAMAVALDPPVGASGYAEPLDAA